MKFPIAPVIFLSDIVNVGTIVITPQIFRIEDYNNAIRLNFKLNVYHFHVNVELSLITPLLLFFIVIIMVIMS